MSDEAQDGASVYYSEQWARQSADGELIAHLLNAIGCSRAFTEPEASRLEAGIVELFCEAVRRGIDIPELVHERRHSPPSS